VQLPHADGHRFLHGAGIFSATELASQSCGPALAKKEQRRDARKHNSDETEINANSVVVNPVMLIT
jgi:hypothetical protein